MSAGTRNCAVLFMDICDSTGLYENLGDVRALGLVEACLSMAGGRIEFEGGEVIKSVGDGLVGSLATAETALNAAREMQIAVAASELSIRVALNYGPVLEHDHDLYGDTVNVAAHLTSHAKADEITMTEEFVRRLPPHLIDQAQLFDSVRFKGREAPTNVYRMPLETGNRDDVTVIHRPAPLQRPAAARLVLYHMGRQFAVDQDGGDFVVGRDSSCDLVVRGPFVSRQHAAFRVRADSFQFRENSANGSWIAYGGRDPLFVKREVVRIQGEGLISLGQEMSGNGDGLIRFACRLA